LILLAITVTSPFIYLVWFAIWARIGCNPHIYLYLGASNFCPPRPQLSRQGPKLFQGTLPAAGRRAAVLFRREVITALDRRAFTDGTPGEGDEGTARCEADADAARRWLLPWAPARKDENTFLWLTLVLASCAGGLAASSSKWSGATSNWASAWMAKKKAVKGSNCSSVENLSLGTRLSPEVLGPAGRPINP
jgi:hypothetical protein